MRQIDVLTPSASPQSIERIRAQIPRRFDARILAIDTEGGSDIEALERSPVVIPADTLYGLARNTADEWAAHLDSFCTGIFSELLTPVDLRGAYTISTTLRLGQVILPRLLTYLDQAEPGKRVALHDFGLDARQVFEIERSMRQNPPVRKVMNVSALSRVVARKTAELLETADPHPFPATTPAGGALALVGAGRELRSLGAVLNAVEARPVTVMPKGTGSEAVRAAEQLAREHDGVVIRPGDGFGLAGAERQNIAAALRSIQERFRFMTAPSRSRLTLTRFAPLIRMLRQALTLRWALEGTAPAVVVGSLDRTPIGALVRQVAQATGCDPVIVDMQHGTLLPFHIADLLDVNVSLVWNEASRELLASEARGRIEHLEVVGNPEWDSLGFRALAVPEDLREWASKYSVVAYFPQAPKGAYLTRSSVSHSLQQVVEVVLSVPDTALLIKLRAHDEESTSTRALSWLAEQDRVRVISDAEATLPVVLSVAKVAISIYSTALADARAFGVPAISFDPAGIVESLGLDFADEIKVCRSREDLSRALGRSMETGRISAVSSRAFPDFQNPYPERVREALRRTNVPVERAT